MSKSVAIVTGASQGIGQATAIRLARDFSAMLLVARNRANLEQTAAAVTAAGAQALSSMSIWPSLRPRRQWSIKPCRHSAESTRCSISPARCRRSICSR